MRKFYRYESTEGGDGTGAGGAPAPAAAPDPAPAPGPPAPAPAPVSTPTAALTPAPPAPAPDSSALLADMKAKLDELTASNAALKAEAEKAALDARTNAVKAALVKASVAARGQEIALRELGDLDLAKEADQAKLSEWIKANTDFFVRPAGGVAAAPSAPPAAKTHWLADHMSKLFGG